MCHYCLCHRPLGVWQVASTGCSIPGTVRVSGQAALSTGLPIHTAAVKGNLGNACVWAQIQLLLWRHRMEGQVLKEGFGPWSWLSYVSSRIILETGLFYTLIEFASVKLYLNIKDLLDPYKMLRINLILPASMPNFPPAKFLRLYIFPTHLLAFLCLLFYILQPLLLICSM